MGLFFCIALLLAVGCKKDNVETVVENTEQNNKGVLKVERKNCDWITQMSSSCSKPALSCTTPNAHVCKCGDWKCPSSIGDISFWNELFPYIQTWDDFYKKVQDHDPALIEYLNNI